MTKRFLVSVAIILVLLIAVLTGSSFFMLDYSLSPENRGKNIPASWEYMYETYPQIVPWADSLCRNNALRDTFITAPDGIRMHAFYARAAKPTGKTAVIIHGYTDNAVRMMHIGYMYSHDLQYNILLPDLRYSGLTEGDAIQMGWLDRKDVLQWTEMVPSLFGDSASIVMHGISMGAATTMMVSGEASEPAACFVEDCGYTSVWDQFSKELKAQFGLPEFPLLYTADWLCQIRYGWNFQEASALNQVSKCRKPMLFIHGEKDDYVPTEMVYRLYEAKSQPKELWIVPGAAHAASYRLHPQEYTERVRQFTEKYLTPRQ